VIYNDESDDHHDDVFSPVVSSKMGKSPHGGLNGNRNAGNFSTPELRAKQIFLESNHFSTEETMELQQMTCAQPLTS